VTERERRGWHRRPSAATDGHDEDQTMTTTSPAVVGGRTAVRSGSAIRDLRVAGVGLVIAGATILMAIITAEALYPGTYATGANEISDLGGTRPPDSVILQPSATIFNAAMLGSGLVVLVAAWFAHRGLGRLAVTIPTALLGLGAVGVGVFPGDTGTPHALAAMLTFVSGGVAGVSAAVVTRAPFRFLSAALGAISLVALGSYLVVGETGILADLGTGGVERWVAYPIVLWLVAFGGYLTGAAEPAA
jgi:hypothetical membrane protein